MRWAFGLVLAYAALVLAARLACRFFVFPAPRTREPPLLPGATAISFPASDGLTVNALLFPAPKNGRTVVVFHGNGETILDGAARARALTSRGLGVLLVEYRGYGSSDGSPSEQGIYADAEGAMAYLAANGVDGDRVALWGTSLGTGVAIEMARRHRTAALVLVSPYTSMTATVQSHARILPASLVVRDAFDSRSKCGEIRVPTLVVHGDVDGVVPFWMGKEIASAIAGATFRAIEGGGHNDLYVRDAQLLAAIAAHLAK